MTLATAVILSYKRHDMLRRQLVYYANKPVHLIFADGSDTDWGSGASGSIGEMTWEYFRLSGFDSYLERMSESCKRVRTEFMFFVDDEECILWTGVEKAVEFLKQNPDHSCAGGRVDTTALSQRRLCIVAWGRHARPFSLLESHSNKRLISLYRNKRTANLYYQVLRSEDIKIYAQNFEDFSTEGKSQGSIEIAFASFLAISGKWMMGNYPFWIRNGGTNLSDTPRPSKMENYYSFDLSERILRSVSSKMVGGDNGWTSDYSSELASLIQLYLGEKTHLDLPARTRQRLGKATEYRKRIEIGLTRSMHIFFDYCPSIYHLVRPNGLKTFSNYAKTYAPYSIGVAEELIWLEKIWKKFSKGISTKEFEKLLLKPREEMHLHANI